MLKLKILFLKSKIVESKIAKKRQDVFKALNS